MALKKEKLTEFGVKGYYWKLSRFTIDTIGKEVFFTLNLYLDENHTEDRDLEDYTFSSVIEEDFTEKYNEYFTGDKYNNFFTACYMYAKDNIEYFKDAEDV